MSRAAALAPSSRDHLCGPPGSGKTAALAARIAAAIRAGANPHLLLVVAPSRAGAGALAERVQRLCGSSRAKRYRFCSLDGFLRRAAAQQPALPVASGTLIDTLAWAAFSQHDMDPECGTPAELIEEPVQPSHRPVARLVHAALEQLGLEMPSAVGHLSQPQRTLLLDHLFVDDIHLMRQARPWLDHCLQHVPHAVVTSDPDYPAPYSTPPPSCFSTHALSTRARSRARPTPRAVLLDGGAPVRDFASADREIQAILQRLDDTDAPHAVVCCSPRLEARLLIRAALTGVRVHAERADSVYCSTELRLVFVALQAAAGSHAAMTELLALCGLHRSHWSRPSDGRRYRSVVEALAQPEDDGRPESVVATLRDVAAAIARWRADQFNHELVEDIGAWLFAHQPLERPWILDLLVTEVARAPLSRIEFIEALEHTLTTAARPEAAQILQPAELDGHTIPTLWISLTLRHPADRLLAFVYRAMTRATANAVCSRSPADGLMPAPVEARHSNDRPEQRTG